MFEKVVLRRSEKGLPITAGQLAEALLFYQNVHVVIDLGTLKSLVGALGIGGLMSLLQRPGLTAVYSEQELTTRTQAIHGFEVHSFDAMTIVGHESVGGEIKSKEGRFRYFLERAGARPEDAKRFAQKFIARVPTRQLAGNHYIQGGIPAAARADLANTAYMREAIRRALEAIPGGYAAGDKFKLDIVDTELGFHVFTDLDVEGVNRRRAAMIPPLDPITIALLFTHVHSARADLALAAHYGGDFVTSLMSSHILRARHADLLRRADLNRQAREEFTEVVLPDAPTIREVIDSGERTLEEFLVLLDKAGRFKEWIRSANPDEGLVREYIKGVTSQDWIQRLPAKTLRYVITQTLDAGNPLVGFVAGVTDAFIVEKLLGGWRPNHFVEKRLGPFISGE